MRGTQRKRIRRALIDVGQTPSKPRMRQAKRAYKDRRQMGFGPDLFEVVRKRGQ